ncbi:MAG: NAD(P)H-dependent oxidoreductase subunit E [Saprospiraceae bacterium]|jgi:NADH-quinone oxidoreductase subunit E|nr:NAD(P)H-dependent oxidoreductase subunit E [Saprospiraceae bacterium]MBP9210329.1 NAD(P)H-dependent oxidoreductase subunit E [Saprospiraceae bacterium]MBV6474026.1 NADH-quinone oxidoreductase subunit 2 [Saprospiraceae bacterium]
MEFSQEIKREFDQIVARYPQGRQKSGLLPILHRVQEEYGWLSTEAMNAVAGYLQLNPIEVYEVASFYTMFHLRPVGKYVLEVCRTGPCCLVGAETLLQYLQRKLNIGIGETTPDGLFTLKTVECLASCGTGPVLQIGPEYLYHEQLTEQKLDQLIDSLRSKS